MPVDRPTFSESWYRVAELRPRLRSTVQVHRQHYRGRMWHVIQDPASNQFFRLSDPAYYFVALLDGRRTVADAWRIANDQLGDSSPTQGEAIQLLGQLYTTNLLGAELPPDATGLFRRYHKRVGREVRGYLMNLLFIRIPLFDPDHFLDRWLGIFGRVFSVGGFILWLALLAAGLYSVAGRGAELADRARGILDIENLPLLYVSLIVIKVFHEFGHCFACKKFGKQSGTGGEVHVLGVMFLIFTPLPYMDASSAWALRPKRHRVIIGAAGMMVELAVAAVAAIIWSQTAKTSAVHAVTYNMMFIASVSSLLFNGNPLLRFDGYYILSDLLEMPNLHQRSRGYIYYLIRKYVWGVRRVRTTAHTSGERWWLAIFAVASTAYRIIICIGIILFIASKLFFVGVILAVMAVATWVCVPLGKFARYLATHGELDRVRRRAVISTLAFLAAVIAGVGFVPAPDRYRIDGIAWPAQWASVHAGTDGFVRSVLRPSGEKVAKGDPLLRAENPALTSRRKQLQAELDEMKARKRLAQTQDVAAAQAIIRQIKALNEQIAWVDEELRSLTLRAPAAGTWIAPEIERSRNAFVRRGERVGLVASVDELIVRAMAGQEVAAELHEEIDIEKRDETRRVELRVKGRPDPMLTGRVVRIMPSGQKELPSPALGHLAGGSIQTETGDRGGTKALEPFFEVRIEPDSSLGLLSRQRVVVRVEMPAKPLAVQWWRAILRLFQRRFGI
ncbi:MAG: efflux RND transporter periplasmic adaptor subunit [Planctomycetota bacterium]